MKYEILLKSISKRLKMNNEKRFLYYIHTEARIEVCYRGLTSTPSISDYKQRLQKI